MADYVYLDRLWSCDERHRGGVGATYSTAPSSIISTSFLPMSLSFIDGAALKKIYQDFIFRTISSISFFNAAIKVATVK